MVRIFKKVKIADLYKCNFQNFFGNFNQICFFDVGFCQKVPFQNYVKGFITKETNNGLAPKKKGTSSHIRMS